MGNHSNQERQVRKEVPYRRQGGNRRNQSRELQVWQPSQAR